MRLLSTLTLLVICFTVQGQTFPTIRNGEYQFGTSLPKGKKLNALTYYSYAYIDTESKYTDSTGNTVIIQNSIPKGGGYTDSNGQTFGYRIFWTRIININDTPLELAINFPGDPSGVVPSSDSCFWLFLPSDTMSLEKETLHSYGATGLKSFLDLNFKKPTTLQRTIEAKGEVLFYVGVLTFCATHNTPRAGFVLKGRSLFYRIGGVNPELDASLIPKGRIVLRN